MNPKNKNIWRSDLTEEEIVEAEKKLREWLNKRRESAKKGE